MKKILLLICCMFFAAVNGAPSTASPSPAAKEKKSCLIDVRTPEEFRSGHVKGAVNIPLQEIGTRIKKAVPDTSVTLYLYCRSGRRSAAAAEKLKRLGYTQLRDLKGVSDAAKALKRPVVK